MAWDRGVARAGDGTLADQAYACLRQDIVAGTRPAGERLRIERLRNLYGFGPTPLREALQRLSADGWVVAEGHRGFTVAPLSAALFDDLNTARVAVEKEALRLSIARGDGEWEARAVGAAYGLAKADTALRAEEIDVEEWERANRAFHTALVSACGSVWLLKMRDLLNAQCERYRRVSIHRTRAGRDLHAEHQAIATAAVQRDAAAAVARTEAHFLKTAELLVHELGGDGETRSEQQARKAS
jgi:DNA-binding GntR family transcriptional regulator